MGFRRKNGSETGFTACTYFAIDSILPHFLPEPVGQATGALLNSCYFSFQRWWHFSGG